MKPEISRTGRLDMLDAHDGLKGRLWDSDGTVWTCRFDDGLAPMLPGAWRRTVTVSGRRRGRQIDVRRLQLEPEAASFWDEPSLARLAEVQNVRPLDRLEDLHEAWEADPLIEDPLAVVLEDRNSRRNALLDAT